MSYFFRWPIVKHTPGGHDHDQQNHAGSDKAGGAKYAGREVDKRGWLVPKAGDRVFQEVQSFGAPAKIFGEVYGGKNPRVRITGNNAFLGGSTPHKTYALSTHWLVEDDPMFARIEAHKLAQGAKREAQQQSAQALAEQRKAAALAAGDAPLTNAVKVGDKIYDSYEDRVGVLASVTDKGNKPWWFFVDWGDGVGRSLSNQLGVYTVRKS